MQIRRLFAYLRPDSNVLTFGDNQPAELRRVSLKNLTLIDWLPPSTLPKRIIEKSSIADRHKSDDIKSRESRKEKRIAFTKLHSKQGSKDILLPFESPEIIVARATLESVLQVIQDKIRFSKDVADIVIICTRFIPERNSHGDLDDRIPVKAEIEIQLWEI